MTDQIGTDKLEDQHVMFMNFVGNFIDQAYNTEDDPKVGFILILFPFVGREGKCNYISNAKREDVVQLLKDQLARFEGINNG